MQVDRTLDLPKIPTYCFTFAYLLQFSRKEVGRWKVGPRRFVNPDWQTRVKALALVLVFPETDRCQ